MLRTLLIPDEADFILENSPSWDILRNNIYIQMLKLPSGKTLFKSIANGIEISNILLFVKENFSDYDLIVGMGIEGFLWHIFFRLANVNTPFALIPLYNQVEQKNSFISLMSSQMASPNDILLCGSQSASWPYQKMGFYTYPFDPFGIDLTCFYPRQENHRLLRNKLGIRDNDKVLLYTGRLDQDKNILDLLLAFYEVKQSIKAKLLICHHLSNLNYFSKCLELSNTVGDVIFIRNPSLNELAQYYSLADVFISTAISIYECFGRSPLEAMACGTVPIVSAYNGFRDNIPSECGILIPPATQNGFAYPNTKKFIDKTICVLNDTDLLRKSSVACISHAKTFNRVLSSKRTLECLHAVVNRSIENKLNIIPTLINLNKYPISLKNLYPSIDGENFFDVFEKFFSSGIIPISSSEYDYREYVKFWFSSFY